MSSQLTILSKQKRSLLMENKLLRQKLSQKPSLSDIKFSTIVRSRRHFKNKLVSTTKELEGVSATLAQVRKAYNDLSTENSNLKLLLKKAEANMHRLSSKASYFRSKTNTLKQSVFRRVHELQEELTFWQERASDYEAKVDDFLKDQTVSTFHKGKYCDSLREVYMELMALGVGSHNVEGIIRFTIIH